MKLAFLALSFLATTVVTAPVWAAENLSLPQFDSVGLSGSGDVRIVHGPRQQVILRQGNLSVSDIRVEHEGSLHVRTCRSTCPSNYRLAVEIVTPSIGDLAVSGSGRIMAGGGFPTASNRDLAVNGSGLIDARALAAGQIEAAVSGSGQIRAGSARSLQAAVSGSGRIAYLGRPQVQSAISGSGWIGADR